MLQAVFDELPQDCQIQLLLSSERRVSLDFRSRRSGLQQLHQTRAEVHASQIASKLHCDCSLPAEQRLKCLPAPQLSSINPQAKFPNSFLPSNLSLKESQSKLTHRKAFVLLRSCHTQLWEKVPGQLPYGRMRKRAAIAAASAAYRPVHLHPSCRPSRRMYSSSWSLDLPLMCVCG